MPTSLVPLRPLLKATSVASSIATAERAGEPIPHRNHERRARERRVVLSDVVLVGLVVEKPPPQRRRGRPGGRLELALRDLRLGVAGAHVLGLDEDGPPVHLDLLR